MHILFISRWFPYPADNGSKIRVFNLLKQLSQRHEITLLSFAQKPVYKEHYKKIKQYCCSVHIVPYKEFCPTRLKALLGFFSTRPRSFIDTFSGDMKTLVKEENQRNNFDAVVASEIDSAPYALLVKQTPRVLEDVELAVIYEQYYSQQSLLLKARYWLTWCKLSSFASQMLKKFKGSTVVSKQEYDLVMKLNQNFNGLAIVPNGIDLEINSGQSDPPRPDTLIYPGALTYAANFDAMDFFLNDIFPHIKALNPNVSLSITGANDGVPIGRLPIGNGARLTGYIPDIHKAVAESWGCVVPLRVGGGTRIKILEAMALGTPVIATSKGAEGLDVVHEQNILIADKPDEFGRVVLRLLKDEKLRAKLSTNGRKLVEERYSWDICARQLEELLYRVVVKPTTCNSC